ncbi:GntR family transcriptional regulator [Spirochaetia bacterium]|nr:GntR family transcriptional regulator [Spirochaetia bacterium]
MHTIQKIKTESLRAQVYAQLKEQLLNGTWKEGEKLPSEYELCASFGVSRVTVRAAIQQLEFLGLVETKHGGGTFVKKFLFAERVDTFHPLLQIQKNQDLVTILEYRKIIEKGTIGLAQKKITAGDIQSLETIYKTMVDAVEDVEAYTEADLVFHHRIAEISRNPIVLRVYELISEILSVAMEDVIRLIGPRGSLKYHRVIIDALEQGDKAKCEAVMEEHIEAIIQDIKRSEEFS